jgi:glycosyltransferase involved in cell wall biosynthesis
MVLCGNRFLMDQALKHRPDGVFYVPTVVNTDEYRIKTHESTEALVVGWMGSASTLSYLSDIMPLFSGDAGGPALKVVADRAPDAAGRRVVFEKWSGETEKALLQSFDVGIMPTKDDLWSRGKCGLKLIQYAAAGLPAISHPWGVSADIIEEGRSGFLRTDGPGWREAIDKLGADVDLRKKMGSAARSIAEERYSIRAWGPRVADMVSGL